MKIPSTLWMAILGLSCIGLASCKKTDEITNDLVEEYILDGFYQKGDPADGGLIFEIDGNTGYFTDFGDSYLGNNPSLIKVGDVYLKNITKIGTNKWKADHLHAEYAVISIPNGFHFEETEITLSKSNGIITLEFSNPDKWDMTFTKITDPSNGGGGGGGGGGGSTIDTILAQDFSGNVGDRIPFSFNCPAGTTKLTVKTIETTPGSYLNYADMFLRQGSTPNINHNPPTDYSYTWTADCAGVNPNADSEICVFSNPTSGNWYGTLYAYNHYFNSRVLVIVEK